MFGYVIVNKPELKIREFDEYHGFYCGQCHSLKRYGQIPRLCLNNDLCFLSILLTSLYEKETEKKKGFCPTHPFHKQEVYANELIDYCADMTVLLSYLKCQDDVLDDHSTGAHLSSSILKSSYLKIKEKYPEKVERINKELELTDLLEKEEDPNLDYLASASGRMLGEVYRYREDEWVEYLYQIGFYLGKFIYIMDAFEDIEKDIEKNRFNPFKKRYQEENFNDYVHNLLEMMMSECTDWMEKLPLFEYREILRNILYAGVFIKFEEIVNKRKEKQNDGSISDSRNQF